MHRVVTFVIYKSPTSKERSQCVMWSHAPGSLCYVICQHHDCVLFHHPYSADTTALQAWNIRKGRLLHLCLMWNHMGGLARLTASQTQVESSSSCLPNFWLPLRVTLDWEDLWCTGDSQASNDHLIYSEIPFFFLSRTKSEAFLIFPKNTEKVLTSCPVCFHFFKLLETGKDQPSLDRAEAWA